MRLEYDNRNVHNDFLAFPLAVFHHRADNKKGNTEHKMDGDFRFAPHSFGNFVLYAGCFCNEICVLNKKHKGH